MNSLKAFAIFGFWGLVVCQLGMPQAFAPGTPLIYPNTPPNEFSYSYKPNFSYPSYFAQQPPNPQYSGPLMAGAPAYNMYGQSSLAPMAFRIAMISVENLRKHASA